MSYNFKDFDAQFPDDAPGNSWNWLKRLRSENQKRQIETWGDFFDAKAKNPPILRRAG
jgi:hypothetical protein